ncbi:uncharacterized protein [Oncorhynchus clarkii lewisi]|uniref:uncharacterized protein isoform X1 n=1 Tax=Oncorhynchus clarkii lewisi TaxID=490388 RepID=UPI0039B89A67
MSKISKAVKKVDMEGVIRAIVRLGQAAPGPPPGSCPGTVSHPVSPYLPPSYPTFSLSAEESNTFLEEKERLRAEAAAEAESVKK